MKSQFWERRSRLFDTTLLPVITVLPVVFSINGSSAAQIRIDGAGGFSCEIFAGRTATSKQLEAFQWTIGYLSGRITADPGAWHRHFHSAEDIAQAVVTYCRGRPHATVVEAADWFFE